ncbi:glycosyltransferase family 31 protein [Hyaloscypha variabilis]
MFSPTALRPPGRFFRFRYLVPVIVFLVVVRFSLPGNVGRETISEWGFLRYSNKTWMPEDKALVDSVCGGLRKGNRIVITVNTGATEILERVPTLLRSSLLCVPNLGDRQVFDALDTVPSEVMNGNTDFDLYRKQLELKDPVRVAEFLKGMKDPRNSDTAAAWTLDKYKKLHILEKAWDLNPNMDWYLHVDADTYVIWSTLVAWLAKLDPTKESYLGSLSFINNLPFGHGGSGMLLSGAAMRSFVVHHNGTAARWDYKMQNECCADWVLAQILTEYGMSLMNSWPTIQGETQSTIPFDSSHWCQPLATMHHITPLQAAQMGDFEAKRKDKTKPLTFEELFNDLVSDLIPRTLDDWDNMALGHTENDVHSFDDCVGACKRDDKCLTALWKGDECVLGTDDVKLGMKHIEGDEKKRWKSFWHKERIAAWAEKQKCSGEIKFPFEDGKSSK